jgi:hypothetical protein
MRREDVDDAMEAVRETGVGRVEEDERRGCRRGFSGDPLTLCGGDGLAASSTRLDRLELVGMPDSLTGETPADERREVESARRLRRRAEPLLCAGECRESPCLSAISEPEAEVELAARLEWRDSLSSPCRLLDLREDELAARLERRDTPSSPSFLPDPLTCKLDRRDASRAISADESGSSLPARLLVLPKCNNGLPIPTLVVYPDAVRIVDVRDAGESPSSTRSRKSELSSLPRRGRRSGESGRGGGDEGMDVGSGKGGEVMRRSDALVCALDDEIWRL